MKMLDDFYRKLERQKNTLTVFNPYRNPYNLENLKCYIEQVFSASGPRIMLVGEAPGYKGGRLTGVPFSSGKLYSEVDHPFLEALRTKLILDPDTLTSENTASVVWRYLQNKQQVPLFWNAFPFHPHPSRIQKKNRGPNRAEIKEGAYYLQVLVEAYKPDVIAGLGRAGTACAQSVLPDEDIQYIRHPSYGGKADFIAGMDKIFRPSR